MTHFDISVAVKCSWDKKGVDNITVGEPYWHTPKIIQLAFTIGDLAFKIKID